MNNKTWLQATVLCVTATVCTTLLSNCQSTAAESPVISKNTADTTDKKLLEKHQPLPLLFGYSIV